MTLRTESDTPCPHADVCEWCPQAADDDVCFPIERAQFEHERAMRNLDRAIFWIKVAMVFTAVAIVLQIARLVFG
jgi:hypothetical protein